MRILRIRFRIQIPNTDFYACCRFSTLVSAMSAAGLSRSLAGKRPLTLFAPTNEAFADLNGLADLLNNRNDIRAVSPWRNQDEESKANGSRDFFPVITLSGYR
jgi:hypothetical protein